MFYYLYRTTCLTTGKVYYGVHKTKRLNDGYIGSGSLLLKDIKKYGKRAFRKDIVIHFLNAEEMLRFEKSVVNQAFLERPDVYNIKLGGEGVFRYEDYLSMSHTARERIKGKGHNHTGYYNVYHPVKDIRKKIPSKYFSTHEKEGWIRGMKSPKPARPVNTKAIKNKCLEESLNKLVLPIKLTQQVSTELGYNRLTDLVVGIKYIIKRKGGYRLECSSKGKANTNKYILHILEH